MGISSVVDAQPWPGKVAEFELVSRSNHSMLADSAMWLFNSFLKTKQCPVRFENRRGREGNGSV